MPSKLLHIISKLIGVIYSVRCASVPSIMSVKQMLFKILTEHIQHVNIPLSSLTFLTSESIGVIYFSTKHEVSPAKASQNIGRTVSLYVQSKLTLDLVTSKSIGVLFCSYPIMNVLKISSIHCGLPTDMSIDRQMQSNNNALFFKRGQKNKVKPRIIK
jgi:hypothetical protein